MSTNLIAAHEGQQVHNTLVDALVAQEIKRRQNAELARALAEKEKAENEARRMRKAYAAYWMGKIIDARDEYSENPELEKGWRALLGIYGLAVYVVASGWNRLMEALNMKEVKTHA